jgi:hypothetical protein
MKSSKKKLFYKMFGFEEVNVSEIRITFFYVGKEVARGKCVLGVLFRMMNEKLFEGLVI